MKKFLIFVIIVIPLIFLVTSCYNNVNEQTSNDMWETTKKDISFFDEKKTERYKNYKNKFPEKEIEQIIIDVNIGLDNDFYTNTQPSKNINSINILVNKYNYLERNYIPNDLVPVNILTKMVKVAADAFNNMINAAKKEGYTIVGVSGYRSYSYQDNLYKKYVKIDGIKEADTYSARAGHSEHQTGLAIDISNGNLPYTSFEETKEFNWMQKNAHKYGFILRYPENKEKITGYMYEAWHYRYVGENIAAYIKKHNITFDEYYAMFLNK